MQQKDTFVTPNTILIVATVLALFADCEILGALVLLAWMAKGIIKVIEAGTEGGVFDR